MKVVHVISGLTKGGGERMAVELANQAILNGDEVTILAGWPVDKTFLQDKIHSDIEVKFVASKKYRSYFAIIPWVLKNKGWLSTKDILHCHLTYGLVFGSITNFLFKKISKSKKPIIIETNHSVGMKIPKYSRWLQSKMALSRDGIVLMAKDPYWDNFINKHKSIPSAIIPNGIATVNIESEANNKTQLLDRFNISSINTGLVGTISMLRPDRKPILYVPIFEDIYYSLGKEVHFLLGGSGIEQNKIETLVREKKIEKNFHFLGLVNDPTKIMRNLDVYVSISVGETTGISMIEAAMCNVPVVGIQLTEGYQPKESDWVWSHTDIKEVAKKIIFLLQNELVRKDMATAQKKYVLEHFTSEAMYKAYTQFYKKVIERQSKIIK